MRLYFLAVIVRGFRDMSEGHKNVAERPSAIRRATMNFGKLLRGRSVAAVLELVTVALVARALSPAEFGDIVLVQTYVLIVRGLFHFKLHEVVVRFGVPLLETGENRSFRRLLGITLRVDFLSSIVATVIAMSSASLVGKLLGWNDGVATIAMFYSAVLVTYGFGTAKGVLRLFDRFDLLGIQLMIGPVLRLIGIYVALVLHPTMLSFVVVLAIATVVENTYLIASGWAELRRQTGSFATQAPPRGGWWKEFPELRKFMGIVYWQGNVDMLPRHISTLLAGAMLGSAGAGLLRLARETTKILSTPGALIRQVIFPDLVRMWVQRASAFKSMLLRAILISLSLGFVFIALSIVWGAALFTAALGAEYSPVAPLATLLLLSATIELVANVLRAAGYAIGDAGKILRLHIISSVLYLALFSVLTPYTGLMGPGIAACLAALVPLGGIGLLVIRRIREQRATVD